MCAVESKEVDSIWSRATSFHLVLLPARGAKGDETPLKRKQMHLKSRSE